MIVFTKLLAFSKISLKRSSSQGISSVNLELAGQQSNVCMTDSPIGLYCWQLSVCSIQLDNLQHAKRPLLLEMQGSTTMGVPMATGSCMSTELSQCQILSLFSLNCVCVCVCMCVHICMCASACLCVHLCAVCTLMLCMRLCR